MAFKERKVGEEELLEAVVFLWIERQREDDPDGDLLFPGYTQARRPTFIGHVETLFYRPGNTI